MSLFANYLNRTITVNGYTVTTQDGGGQDVGTTASKGTVKGRIDPRLSPNGQSNEVNGPDLNPVISEFIAITALPVGFSIVESDTLTTGGRTYEVLGVASLDGRSVAHHLEIDLRRIS